MKNNFIYLAILVSLCSSYSYPQNASTFKINKKLEVAPKESDTFITISPTHIKTIKSYHVKEHINQKFGGYTTSYEVSDLNLIYFYDLGPNNSRIITPHFGAVREIPRKQIKLNKNLLKSTNLSDLVLINKTKIEPLSTNITIACFDEAEKEVIAEAKDVNKASTSEKYIYIHLIKTYERIAEKGCKSIEIFQKLGDAYFFDGDYVKAVKWYGELFNMTTDLETEYFERYAYSLRAIGKKEQANEIIKLLHQLSDVKKNKTYL
jgi:tetratricopeptide (TPR) repeat protein